MNLKNTALGGFVLVAAVFSGSVYAFASSVLNGDSTEQTLVVTEGASKRQITVQPGEQITICPNGCFVTFPNGDREALTGTETLTIMNGGSTYK